MTKGDGQHTRVISDDNKSLKSEAVVSRTISKIFECICVVIRVAWCEEIYLIISRKNRCVRHMMDFHMLRGAKYSSGAGGMSLLSSCFKTAFACLFSGHRILGCHNRNFDKQDATYIICPLNNEGRA